LTDDGQLNFLTRRSDFQGMVLKGLIEEQGPFVTFSAHKIPEMPVVPVGFPPERITYDIGSLNVTQGSFIDVSYFIIKLTDHNRITGSHAFAK